MKRTQKVIITSVIVFGLSTGVAFAAESTFINTLVQGIMTKLTALVTPNINQGSSTVQSEAAKVQQNIQNYNDQYVQDLSNNLNEFTTNYSNQKVQELKNLENQYKQQMDAEKTKIIADLQKQIQQELDKQFDKSTDDILKGIK